MTNPAADSFIEGKILFFDKEIGWTSFDVVNKLRVSLRDYLGIKKIKVGHAGTLDPLASGLVIVCTGKATKQIDSFLGLDKEYIAEIKLGATTPSFDLETSIDNTYPIDHISPEILYQTLDQFRGDIEQVPPIFSAKQINGKRAYDLARQGETVELKKQIVRINELEILRFEKPFLEIRVNCSKGTYIRSLANDIGKALNSGAYLSALRRTRIGEYHVKDAENVSDFVKKLRPL